MKTQSIDIVLPSRIGDSILSIPAIVCLEQLSKKYNSGLKIRVLSKPFLVEMFSNLQISNYRGMSWAQKLRSVFFLSDYAFFIETTNDNLGYFSKASYGTFNKFKKFLKFSHEPTYLKFSFMPFPETWEKIKQSFPQELVSFLQDECRLPWYSIVLFGICLELGFTAEQIISTFKFSPEIIDLSKFNYKINEPYVVFCAEAGYGRKHLNERCWDIDGYFQLADRIASEYNVKTVFIGVNQKMPLPEKDYIIDLRGKVSIIELAGIMKSALCYIGNDTGPMHVANLMNTRSVSMYFREEHTTGFHPIFPQFNTQLLRPEGIDTVYEEVKKVLCVPAPR